MKIRIKFTKEASVKFLGHLDIMRFFQKCFVRAHVKMLYSEGFNPHQKLSFALPLGVGITSCAEYLDADVEDGQNLLSIKEGLNRAGQGAFKIIDIRVVETGAESLMSIVGAASYEIKPCEGTINVPEAFINAPCVNVIKTTKKGSKEVDIKPFIIEMKQEDALKLTLLAGSENNLKPELLLMALCDYNGSEYRREDYEIRRTGLYTKELKDLIEYQTYTNA